MNYQNYKIRFHLKFFSSYGKKSTNIVNSLSKLIAFKLSKEVVHQLNKKLVCSVIDQIDS
ncbi:hypothetical protein BpHYR1_018186 [Brachionus plicatilis]|uniref:Uncharacterized protein n=1 Tax=Brachionus plicatilis TaxID=10195 RepID=A0A3M7Q951_BRAPC|nr:hypothetical protein BpHYR1_018186 [Brachionus plicatilis]